MQQNYQNTRYNVPWDFSNQNKRYTIQEKKIIEQSIKNNKSSMQIAKILKRGLWAIEVQIMYIKNKNNNNHNNNNNNNHNNNFSITNIHCCNTLQSQHLHKQKTQKQQTQRKNYQTDGNSNWKKCDRPNRKFQHVNQQKIIKTSSILIENHLSELMGL